MLNQSNKSLNQWLSHLEQGQSGGLIDMGLERMKEAKKRLSLSPKCPVITVGGTNGKGSVCAFLTAIYREAGFQVGTLTSPHLLRFNERIALNGVPCGDAQIVVAFEEIQAACGDLSLTYFEYNTLAAMIIFLKNNLDVIVLEVGLGGRLDAVNAFDADVAIVSSLAIDHVHFLSDDLNQISYEKAGIFRPNKPALIGQKPLAKMVQYAEEIGANLLFLNQDFQAQSLDNRQWSFIFSPTSNQGLPEKKRHALPIPALRGHYQINNAALALAAIECLNERLPINIAAIKTGLLLAQNPGRFQVLPGRPVVVLDVAHNPHAARALHQNLIQLPFAQNKMAVFAMLSDKDIASVVAQMKDEIDIWLISSLPLARSASVADIKNILINQGVKQGKIEEFGDIQAACESALSRATENDRIVAFGSFYTVAAAMDKLK